MPNSCFHFFEIPTLSPFPITQMRLFCRIFFLVRRAQPPYPSSKCNISEISLSRRGGRQTLYCLQIRQVSRIFANGIGEFNTAGPRNSARLLSNTTRCGLATCAHGRKNSFYPKYKRRFSLPRTQKAAESVCSRDLLRCLVRPHPHFVSSAGCTASHSHPFIPW